MRNGTGCVILTCASIFIAGCASAIPQPTSGMEGAPLAATPARAEGGIGTGAYAGAGSEEPLKLDVATPQRIVIYSGVMGLVVSDIRQTIEQIRLRAIDFGGYYQEMEATSITIRIPASRFNEAVAFVATLGEVVQQHIKSQDVTEEMRDLKIRLDNAQQTRTRLLAILDKSTKVEDTLKIEAELERITETIELLKGKIQSLESQVAYSALKVQLNSPLPQKQLVAAIPFDWVRRLGEGVISGAAAPYATSSSRERREIRFETPKSYIRYFDRDQVSEAMSADGVLIKLQKNDNYRGGDAEFWSKLARRALVENRSVKLEPERIITTKGSGQMRLMVGTRDLGGRKSGYLVGIAVTKDEVYAFEAWGPLEQFQKDLPDIQASASTLQVD